MVILVFALFYFFQRSAQPLPEDGSTQTSAQEVIGVGPMASKSEQAASNPAEISRVKRLDEDQQLKKQTLTDEQLRERRSEAKMALASFYSGQKAFHAEYKRYSTDLKAIGWRPNEPLIKYKIGFVAAFRPSSYSDSEEFREDPTRLDTDSYINDAANELGEVFKYDERVESVRLSDYETYCKKGCTADETGFEILVVMPLGNSGRVDVWSINDQKEIRLISDGAEAN